MTDDELDELIEVVRRPEKPGETLAERVALLEDRQAIADLIMAYGWLCDRRRWEDLLALYTDDITRTLRGTLDEQVQGKEKLRELYERPVLPRSGDVAGPPSAEQIGRYELRHLIHPPVIRVSDDRRQATAAAVYSLVATSGDGPELRRGEHEGAYLFGMRREPAGWRFASMVIISENARNPLFTA